METPKNPLKTSFASLISFPYTKVNLITVVPKNITNHFWNILLVIILSKTVSRIHDIMHYSFLQTPSCHQNSILWMIREIISFNPFMIEFLYSSKAKLGKIFWYTKINKNKAKVVHNKVSQGCIYVKRPWSKKKSQYFSIT